MIVYSLSITLHSSSTLSKGREGKGKGKREGKKKGREGKEGQKGIAVLFSL